MLFHSSDPPDFVLVSHTNSSSIKSVFSLATSQNRDTPQGFCTSIAVQSSTEAIAVLKTSQKPAYAAEDIPDIDVSVKRLICCCTGRMLTETKYSQIC